jgi:protein-S-isoprenylcysteine O-methyltransferase Ste14
MTELLRGLGFARASWWSIAWLCAVIAAATSSFLAFAHVLATAFGVPVVATHAALWVIWLVWLGVVFPRSRRAWMRGFGAGAFRPAFYLEILPGIACSFAQIARPAVAALLAGPRLSAAGAIAGGTVAAAGLCLIVLGVRRLGIAGTLFVREYETLPPLLERDGIFREIRHPLFVGGAALALGSAVALGGGRDAILLGAINVLAVPVYVRFEDARCGQVFGTDYAGYREHVGGALPRRRRALPAKARARG